MNNNLGKIIQELRNKKGYTQKDLAEKLHVSDKAVSRWETGISIPHVETLVSISKLFKVQLQDLIVAAASSEDNDDSLVQDVIKEFTRRDREKTKLLQIISLTFIVSVFSLIIAIVFIKTYNRFKVYEVYVENDNINLKNGVYVETRIKDELYLTNIRLKNYDIKEDDIVSVDLYYKYNNKDYVLQSFSSFENIKFSSYESYIKINNLNKYLNNLYLKVIVIKSNNEEIKYDGRLKFMLSFSNSKVVNKEDNSNYLGNNTKDFSKEEIKQRLIKNGFKISNEYSYKKNIKGGSIYYFLDSNIFKIYYVEGLFTYSYTYRYKINLLSVKVFNEKDVEIEDYKYYINKDNVLDCKIGSCYSYKNAKTFITNNIDSIFK